MISEIEIIQIVSDHFKVSIEDINGKSRLRKLSVARSTAAFFVKKYTMLPLDQIGKLLGARDHSTICHCINNVNNWNELEKSYQQHFKTIKEEIELTFITENEKNIDTI